MSGAAVTSETTLTAEERLYVASQWQLMWRKFRRHKLAMVGGAILAVFYFVAVFCEFFATQDIQRQDATAIYLHPQRLRFIDAEGRFHLRPFVYGVTGSVDEQTWRRIYVDDPSQRYPLSLFVHGDPYKLWGLFETDIRLLGVEGGRLHFFGTDMLGRDVYSRTIHSARISLSVGMAGVALSFLLGCILGGISGYYGGLSDLIIQRAIEILLSIPTIPLWMALAAALPPQWSAIRVYFGITIILSLIGWTGLARVVRGKLLEEREADYVMAARFAGAGEMQTITRHLLPSFLSYLVVHLTLAIPQMILGETALSFLGIGLRPPVVSWGVMLKDAQNYRTVVQNPWLLIPGLFVIVVVLSFNFLGDGLRDAADPYK
jgi:peptide/nickel transport system permease protein